MDRNPPEHSSEEGELSQDLRTIGIVGLDYCGSTLINNILSGFLDALVLEKLTGFLIVKMTQTKMENVRSVSRNRAPYFPMLHWLN